MDSERDWGRIVWMQVHLLCHSFQVEYIFGPQQVKYVKYFVADQFIFTINLQRKQTMYGLLQHTIVNWRGFNESYTQCYKVINVAQKAKEKQYYTL